MYIIRGARWASQAIKKNSRKAQVWKICLAQAHRSDIQFGQAGFAHKQAHSWLCTCADILTTIVLLAPSLLEHSLPCPSLQFTWFQSFSGPHWVHLSARGWCLELWGVRADWVPRLLTVPTINTLDARFRGSKQSTGESPKWWQHDQTPALRELRQGDYEFDTSLGYVVTPCLKWEGEDEENRDQSQGSSVLTGCRGLNGSHTHTLQVYLQSGRGLSHLIIPT